MTGVRALAAIPLRARSRVHRPKQKFTLAGRPTGIDALLPFKGWRPRRSDTFRQLFNLAHHHHEIRQWPLGADGASRYLLDN
jgi:hypothetical protein